MLVDALRVLEAQDVSHERRRVRAAPDALLFVLEGVALPRRRGAERRRGAGRRRRAAEPRQQSGAGRRALSRGTAASASSSASSAAARRAAPDGLEGPRRRDEALEHGLRLGVFAEVRRELLERLDHVREAVLRLVGRGVARDRRQVVPPSTTTTASSSTASRPPARRITGSTSCEYVMKMSAAPSWIWSCAMWNGQTCVALPSLTASSMSQTTIGPPRRKCGRHFFPCG